MLEAADGSGTREIAREFDTFPPPSACGGGALPAKGSTGLRICHAPARRRSTAKPPTSAYGRCSIGHHPKALPVERTADREGPGRRRRAVRLAFPAQTQDRSRRSQELVREQRSGVRQQGCRCGRPLHGAARQCRRHMCRRKPLDAGAGARAGLSEAAERTHADGTRHDYKRHGTTTLFAAFEVATGKVTGAHEAPAPQEFLAFMDAVVATFPRPGSRSSSII